MSDINNLGMGVMLKILGGNEDSVKAYQDSLNKVISAINLYDDKLVLVFTDNTALILSDEGQSCCEHRYMTCDDTLQEFIGAKLLSAEVKEAPSISMEYGDHDIAFLDINTDKGTFQISNHNEHNGYYGGFAIRAKASRVRKII